MTFQLVLSSTTLDDLKRPCHTLLHKWRVFRSSARTFERR